MVRLRPVPADRVELRDGFWRDRCDANARQGIPRLYERFEQHGVIDNFRRLLGLGAARRGPWFTDSDLYKWMEAAAWVGAEELEAAVPVVLAAQAPDGYLNTNFGPDERFAGLDWSHELYCIGHFIQAAVARKRAQGRDDLLDARLRAVRRWWDDLVTTSTYVTGAVGAAPRAR
jgi:DUF1680 family protein